MEELSNDACGLQEPFFEAVYMQISKPDGNRWRDFAINKKHIRLSDSLRAVLLSVTPEPEISGVTGEQEKPTLACAIIRLLRHTLFSIYFPFGLILSWFFHGEARVGYLLEPHLGTIYIEGPGFD